MRKITRRAVSVLLIALLVILGMTVYVLRYIDQGRDWATYFSRLNSASTGEILDRNGFVLSSFSASGNHFPDDALTRIANYHVTGDYWGRTGTGVLSRFWGSIQNYSLITGTTESVENRFQLNVDARLNRAAYEALDGRKGAVLMVNYRSGELLCMVSSPAVDPEDGESEPPEGAFINRCLSASFVPGSVFKLITAAAAIETLPDIDSRSFFCDGSTEIAGIEIKCSGEHWTQTFEQALSNSCNVAFAKITTLVGQDAMVAHVRDYGFLDRHELDGIPTAAGSYPLEFVGDPELAWSGIGQSTDLVCPYSLLRYVSAIANDGVLCEPRLIRDGADPVRTAMVEPVTARKLQEMMNYNVVSHYGGEENFPGLSTRLCAKTGTAELGDGTSHAWFTGFLQDENNPYAFVVLIEQGGGGLSAAGAAANRILQYALGR